MGVFEDHWNYEININEKEQMCDSHFKLEINNLNKCVLDALSDGFLKKTESQDCEINYDNELQLLTQSNKELKQEIDIKLKELSRQQTQYENFKQDQRLLKQEVKDTHEAFLMARKHYKKFLNMYYTIETKNNETQVIFVQFFTELKKNTDNYSVYLVRDINTKYYTLKSVNPMFKTFKDLQKKLQETNDVCGVLCYIRQIFINLRQAKDH